MFGRPKLLIASLIIAAFGIAMLNANSADRVEALSSELVEATEVLPQNEGRLVMVTGMPQLVDGGVISDEEAGLTVQHAVRYSRVPYQKVYALRSREVVIDKGEDKMSDVDDITETEYYVAQDWIVANQSRGEVVTSNGTSYQNPRPASLEPYHASGDLRVGGFAVSAGDISAYLTTQNATFTPDELRQVCGKYITRSELNLEVVPDEDGHGMLSTGDDIGDVHVRFSYQTLEDAQEVTLIGRQRGDRLVLEDEDVVDGGEQVRPGRVTKDQILEAASAEDAFSRKFGIGFLVLAAVLFLFSILG